MAYNTTHQAYKSSQLQALDCRPTGQTKMIGFPGEQLKIGRASCRERV